MITPFQQVNNNLTDQSPNVITLRSFNEIVTAPPDFAYRGTAQMPIAKTIQSSNFIKGVQGWKLDSNGTTEIH